MTMTPFDPPQDAGGRLLRAIFGVLGLCLLIYVTLLARNAAKAHDYIGRPEAARDTIAISAEGKVTAQPDVASISVGVMTEKKTVAEAQKENTAKMNAIVAKIKSFGVSDDDIKTTNYSIYPQYDWIDNRQIERGFQVSQEVQVKVRDLAKIGDVLSAVGELGANQVGGVTFTIDDPEDLRQQARLQGLAKAKSKAQALAEAAGVKLGKVVGFSENESGVPGPVFYSKDAAMGLGGGGAAAPSIESGSQDVVVNVTVLYEILP
ncbi:MAG TPA: SIMPL domain-containing protein [Candidatus Baltobacteraceae bacterium]|nr:SIMPL domain-containing protein [Candidatus Baltobacteraceae bacterium]